MNNKVKATGLLQETRRAEGINQQDMADMLSMSTGKNISKSLYQKWERGALSVAPNVALKVARALHLPFNELWEAEREDS